MRLERVVQVQRRPVRRRLGHDDVRHLADPGARAQRLTSMMTFLAIFRNVGDALTSTDVVR